MTTRIPAATVATLTDDTLPDDTALDPRAMLATAGAAAVLAAIGMPAAAVDNLDAELVTLGTKWRASHAGYVAAMRAMDEATARA